MTHRGTTNRNDRGSSEDRRARKRWLLTEFGNGRSAPCLAEIHHEDCPGVVVFSTMTVDRIVPGKDEGTYRRENIRPAWGRCNSKHGGHITPPRVTNRKGDMSLHAALNAARRARALVADLEHSNRGNDRHQVAAGVAHELETIDGILSAELERLGRAARGDRPGKVRADASEPSRTAARAIVLKSGTARYQILMALWSRHNEASPDQGLTDLDLQNRLNLNPSTERPRRGELVDAGLVESIGTRGQAGSDWTVWAITQAGADVVSKRTGSEPLVVTPEGEPRLF